MKKSQVAKVNEPRYRSSSSNRKLRKKTEKPNITARRLTLLPGFLRRGVKSETVQKSINAVEEFSGYDDEVLKENLHGLLREDKPPRRSTRLSKKTASGYFLEVLSDPKPKLSPVTNRSKSIFKEIKEKYARKVEHQVNHDFGARIFAKLGPCFVFKDSDCYKQEILEEVTIINDVLAGKLDSVDMSINRKNTYLEEEKENFPLKFPHVPPTKWVFQTPPNRKLNFNHVRVEDSCIQPAILETRSDNKVVYEVNNKFKMDFTQYSNRQEVDIDKRYMVEVANLQNPSEEFTFQIHEEEEEPEKKVEFQSDPYELENHFLSLTCRPKRPPCTISRIPGHKRKRYIFDPEQGCSTDLDEFESGIASISNNLHSLEESFTFKFTANDGATTGHLFDFDGNKKNTFNFQY